MKQTRVLFLSGIFILLGCDSTPASFSGTSKRLSTTTYTNKGESGATAVTPAPTPQAAITPLPEVQYSEAVQPDVANANKYSGEFDATLPVNTSLNSGVVWAVTGHWDKAVSAVYRVELDESRGYPVWRKEIPFEWGNRSYVSEIGFLIGRSQRAARDIGGIYVAGPQFPNGILPIFTKNNLTAAEQASLWMTEESRMCVTSFRVDGVSYVGGGYRSIDGHKRFVRIPIDKSKPNGADVSRKQIFDLGVATAAEGNWGMGYSCFTDQKNSRYWSEMNGTRTGVDLVTGAPLSWNQAPNVNHPFNNGSLNLVLNQRASYAMAGSANGDLASFAGAYTAAHESVSDFLYVSMGNNLRLLHASCISSRSECGAGTGRFFDWDLSKMTDRTGATYKMTFGPLSSLNDGRVAGVRYLYGASGNQLMASELYLISPKNPDNFAEGPVLKKIADMSEMAYMYTDFTGATLYAASVSRDVSLAEFAGFKAGVPVASTKFVWKASSGSAENWRGLNMKVRCFLKTAATRPAWQNFVPAKGNEEKELGCTGLFDTVEFSVEGDGANDFSRTAQFVFKVKQLSQ
jgi:hypothetical protein